MAALTVPAIASAKTRLFLGGPTSPPSYSFVSRIGDLKFNGVAIDTDDVSNQESVAHRFLGTLLNIGDLTGMLYWEPDSTQDFALFGIVLTAPPPLQQWVVEWPDGTVWAFNGYLTKFAPDSTISKALKAPITIKVDNSITVNPTWATLPVV
jgi:hypothetical protein